jgi:lipoprotein-anchoring transpeptidase ErfK/SrfK
VQWKTTEPLGYNRRYTLTAKARGLGGEATRQMTFRTHSPQNLSMPYVLPRDGEVVGVGEPVAIRFDENIANRATAEKAITVTTDSPVEGAFYRLNNREVRWRPKEFWKSGTAVDVAVNTYGVDPGNGLFGEDNMSTHFTIGDQVIATADDITKVLTVRVNGEVVKTMPISMGKDSTPTANGIYIIGDRFAHMIMDSSTYGVPVNSPNGYRTEVDCATQMSYKGCLSTPHRGRWAPRATPTPATAASTSVPATRGGSTTTPNAGTSSKSSTPSARPCREPKGSATGTSRGASGTPATPTRDAYAGRVTGHASGDDQDHSCLVLKHHPQG